MQPSQSRKAKPTRQMTARTEEVRTGHRADSGRSKHKAERAPAYGTAANFGGGVPAQEDSRIRDAERETARKDKSEALNRRANDHDGSTDGTERITPPEPRNAACLLRATRDQDRARCGSDDEQAERYTGQRRTAGQVHGDQGPRGTAGRQTGAADRGSHGEEDEGDSR